MSRLLKNIVKDRKLYGNCKVYSPFGVLMFRCDLKRACEGATIYQTHSPCKECSKLILQSGISRLVYIEDYKDLSGVDFFKGFWC